MEGLTISKVAGIIGKIAAVVAIAASIALLFVPGGQVFGIALLTIATAASAVSAVAMAISQATMKPPDMQGTVNQVMIGKNMPVPYVLGRTYVGGMMVYDKSANGPDNYDRTQIMVGTAAGPIESFEALKADYTTITISGSSGGLIGPGAASGFYNGYLWASSRKGNRPETALATVPPRAAFSQWDSTYKLSGYAAWAVTMEFDEDGVRYASGIPQWGMVAKWTKVYDPRKDSTYPGGVGTQRWNDEATWAYGTDGTGTIAQGENPALQALAYARGRFVNGVRVVGVGLPQESVLVDQFVELANLCDANGWRVGGAVYEGPGISKWENLKRILQAAACQPAWTGGALGLRICSPRVALFEVGLDDLADGELELVAMQGWRDRINTVVPRVRLEDQKWEYTQIAEVANTTYITEDGEAKTKEIQYDLVQNATHGAELAAYEIVNSRELGPWQIPLKPYFMPFRIGEAGDIDLGALTGDSSLGVQLATIVGRTVDPGTGIVTLTFETETSSKHAYALGQTGVAPPSPTIIPPEQLDEAVSDTNAPGWITLSLSEPGFLFIDGIPADPAQVITITAEQNKAGVPTWSVSPSVTLGAPSAETRTLSLTNFGSNVMVTVTATSAAGVVTSITIPRIDYTTPGDSIIPDSNFTHVDDASSSAPWKSATLTKHIP
jgi:hypothetical protein